MPEAEAEHRHAGVDALVQQLVEPERADRLHRLAERAHAREDDQRGVADAVVVGRPVGRRADVLERLLDAAEVAHAVVDDRDARHRSPLVDGIAPPASGSIATAWRSARANALNAASTMWCGLRPASMRTCSVSFAADATARKNSSSSPASQPAIPSGATSPSNAV